MSFPHLDTCYHSDCDEDDQHVHSCDRRCPDNCNSDAPHVGHFSRLGGTYWCDTLQQPVLRASMTTAEAVSAYIAASERHERLKWALKARRALERRNLVFTRRGRDNVYEVRSTFPGQQGQEPMGDWERSQLDGVPEFPDDEPAARTRSDADALDLLNEMLSAEEWSVSMLEDAAEIVRSTGREEVKGATWASH